MGDIDELFLQKLASSGQITTADIGKLVQDYEELKALRKVVEVTAPLVRGLELVQMMGDPYPEGFEKELRLQQALNDLDKTRQK